jgi:hypothetical protein
MGEMMREVADDVRVLRVPGTAHFIAEENPVAMADSVAVLPVGRGFLDREAF